MNNRFCKDCQYSELILSKSNGSITFVKCHRYPPTYVRAFYKFPDVNPDSWCGEYKHKENINDIRNV